MDADVNRRGAPLFGDLQARFASASNDGVGVAGRSTRLAIATIIAVTIVELYLGIILFFKLDLKYGLSAATGLIFAFTVFLWYLSTLAHPPACGCMGLTGLFKSNRADALFGVGRNVVILWLLKFAYDYYCKQPPEQKLKPEVIIAT